jgi:hypothetical protein
MCLQRLCVRDPLFRKTTVNLYNIYLSISQSTQQFLQLQNKHYCVNICLLCACDIVPLRISTLLLCHHQAGSNTGFSN